MVKEREDLLKHLNNLIDKEISVLKPLEISFLSQLFGNNNKE